MIRLKAILILILSFCSYMINAQAKTGLEMFGDSIPCCQIDTSTALYKFYDKYDFRSVPYESFCCIVKENTGDEQSMVIQVLDYIKNKIGIELDDNFYQHHLFPEGCSGVFKYVFSFEEPAKVENGITILEISPKK